MGNLAIKAEGLSKRYRIGVEEQRHETLAGAVFSWVRSPVRNYQRLKQLSTFSEDEEGDDIIWALRNISFEIKHGETVGIIGRNGTGKSTLLKILARITEPSSGYARVNGRVASLLEVGTGFHPELTGRENVYLNGTVLGMSKSEVDRKFDEIVDFSEVGKFIDTPVKRYSSGMRVRLAFAVAAHLEPEILLIDEVLSVGDMSFQKKCVGKMEDVAHDGRTVFFVSHHMAMVQALCNRGILLEGGEMVCDTTINDAVSQYMKAAEERSESTSLAEREQREAGTRFRFTSVEFLNPESMEPLRTVLSGQPVLIRLGYRSMERRTLEGVHISIDFFNAAGVYTFGCSNEALGKLLTASPGDGEFYFLIPKFPLNHGRFYYNLFARLGRGLRLDYVREAGFVDVELGDFYGTGIHPEHSNHQGMFIEYDWFDGQPVYAR